MNHKKKKSLYVFSTDVTIAGLTTQHTTATSHFGGNIFNTGLKNVFNLSTDVEPVDIEPTVFVLHTGLCVL